jgi:uncharacterized heparinase superfamily protein
VSLLRTLHTARHLKPGQVSNRVLRRFRHVPSFWSEAGSYELVLRHPQRPAATTASWTDGSNRRFIGLSGVLEGADRWRAPRLPRLWAYQLHYFRWLWEKPAEAGLPFVRDWLTSCLPGSGAGWEPYPLSIRIREWTEWLLANLDLPSHDRGAMVASLAHQAHALERQLEFHLLGNHLLENAITLCWAGLSLRGPASSRWTSTGLRLLSDQLAVQVLPDGCHDERSPMYQALLAEALLRLAGVASACDGEAARNIGRLASEAGLRLAVTLAQLTHPDGNLALLNDAAFDEAPTIGQLQARFGLAGVDAQRTCSPWELPAAGYAGVHGGEFYLVFDAGPLGPDCQPGHGHADTLSFELSSHGNRVVCDTGVMTYEPGPVRAADRGTGAHNTIAVDGRDQSELWGAFRCGRRARVVDRKVTPESRGMRLSGEYVGPGHGFRRSVRHRREIHVSAPESSPAMRMAFSDRVSGRGDHNAVLRLHTAPGIAARPGSGGWLLMDRSRVIARLCGQGFAFVEGRSPYHPCFGREEERICFEARLPFRDTLEAAWSLDLDPGS